MGRRYSLRGLGIAVGIAMVAVGGWVLWAMNDPTKGAPSVIALHLRPPEAGGDWRVLEQGEANAPGDLEVSVGFEVHKSSRRKSPTTRYKAFTTTQLRTAILVPPNTDQSAASEEHARLAEHRELLADHVERRTGRPVYAEAVRREGEWISVDETRQWIGFGLLAAGLVTTASCIRDRF